MKKLISWNVNGLRAVMKKGFMDAFSEIDADFFCLQEIKLQEGQIEMDLPGYHQYWNYAEKKGYSGTAIFAKEEPMNVLYGLGEEEFDTEGRLIVLEYPEYYVATVYTPNAQPELQRLPYRMNWDDAFRNYMAALNQKKPVLFCGDLNVAHEEIDLKNPKPNRGHAGFTDEERNKFDLLLEAGFTDTFRYLHPEETGAYSWWSYMRQARQNNAGWRIDYFLISNRLDDHLKEAFILPEVMGSDHCPVGISIEL